MEFLFLISIIPCFIYYIMKGNKSLHMLQQNWYDEGLRYFRWMLTNKFQVFIDIDMFFITFIVGLLLETKVTMCYFIVFYCAVAVLFLRRKAKEQVKKPLAYTKRVKRLIVTEIVLFLIPVVVSIFTLNTVNYYIFYLILGAMAYLSYLVVYLANFINKPIEKMVGKYYHSKAKNKLARLENLDVIGITGSYGKTSSKNILNDILSIKYNVCPTPKNFNTPNGLMITINNYLDKFTEVFIAEMGAFKMGEIKELCDFVHPKYGIITTIGTAHMESFGSRENIQKGKFELLESLPSDGACVLNMDDEYQVSYERQNDCKVIWIGIDNKKADVYASNIKQSYKGMSFDVTFKGDKQKYTFETKLLGTPNVYNILAAVALGDYLGISKEQLIMGAKRVKSIEHRLELKKYLDVNIIDDAYNSNPVGSKMAVEVLGLMPGKKIIVTPGMIELGEKQDELNMKFGEYMADVCDEVILVGESQTKPILKGLKNKKYKDENIHVINDVKLAFPLMRKLAGGKEAYVLLENDLPDIFNEK